MVGISFVYNYNGHNIYHCIIAESGYSICHMAIMSVITQQRDYNICLSGSPSATILYQIR